jgi:uncharacterized protein YprB with RNaseH-like and TPR domain
MIGDPVLRAKLGALLAGRAAVGTAPAREALRPAPERVLVRGAEPLPGVVENTDRGPIFVHEVRWTAADRGQDQVLAHLAEARERLALLPESDLDPDLLALKRHAITSTLFLDLETGGLSGHPIFLAGFLMLRPGELHLRQVLARTYLEEAALIDEAERLIARHPIVLTYNGKSFDLPMLADRAVRHRIPFRPPAVHVDLLHHARRAFRRAVPNCRLVTLEWAICRRWRARGVESRDIPGIFHRFAREGDPSELAQVLHHNAHDLLTLAELLAHLIPHPPGPRLVLDSEAKPSFAFDHEG